VAFKDFVLGSHLATIDLYVSDEGQVYEAAKDEFERMEQDETKRDKARIYRVGAIDCALTKG